VLWKAVAEVSPMNAADAAITRAVKIVLRMSASLCVGVYHRAECPVELRVPMEVVIEA
jgi:hypothetical protein